jgi:hypothetical protein
VCQLLDSHPFDLQDVGLSERRRKFASPAAGMRVCGHSARVTIFSLADGRARVLVGLWQVAAVDTKRRSEGQPY